MTESNVPCKHCGGTGKVPDQVKLGFTMRVLRGTESLRSFADRTGYSAAYLCDLENGKRRWTEKLICIYTTKARWPTK
jgi:hypothetical protein